MARAATGARVVGDRAPAGVVGTLRPMLLPGRLVTLAVLAVLVCVASACGGDESDSSSPSSSASGVPVRYRDPIASGVTKEAGIVFGEATLPDGSTTELALDLYTPEGDAETGRPVVILVHGGGFITGQRDTGPLFLRWADILGTRGYVVASIDYRLDPDLPEEFIASGGEEGPRLQAQFDGVTLDARQAVRFLTEHAGEYGIDPERIASLGFSAGGTVALSLAHRQPTVIEGGEGPPIDAAIAIASAMPDSWARAEAPPVLMAHGREDETIPYAWGEATCAAIVQVGSECTLYPLEGSHAIPEDQYELLDPVVIDFLATNVAGV